MNEVTYKEENAIDPWSKPLGFMFELLSYWTKERS